MGVNIDIYDIPRQLEYGTKRIRESPDITPANKQAIFDFLDRCMADGLSLVRVHIYTLKLYQLAKWLGKDFTAADRQDIQRLVAGIESNPRYRAGSKSIFKVTLKKFYKWLEGDGEECPAKVRWIKNRHNGTRVMPEDLLTKDEVSRMVDLAANFRDKALISVLAESGFRIGELAGIRMKHITYDEHGAQIMVDGKTGQRRVRLISSINHLTNWISVHPEKSNPDAPLWILLTARNRGKFMNYPAISQVLKKVAARAGVKKRIHAHAFRHSRATDLAKLGFSQAQLSSCLGWTQGTKMAQTYIHLSGQDTDDALLHAYGLKKSEERAPLCACARCNKQNEPSARYCRNCGAPMTVAVAVDLDERKKEFESKVGRVMELLEDQEVLEFLARKRAKLAGVPEAGSSG